MPVYLISRTDFSHHCSLTDNYLLWISPHKLQLGRLDIYCPLNRRREAWEELKATREGYKAVYVLVVSFEKKREKLLDLPWVSVTK